MKDETIKFNGVDIRVTPKGEFNLSDVTQALGYVKQRAIMHVKAHPGIYEGHLGEYAFSEGKRASNTIDLEGAKRYLDLAEGKNPSASRLKKLLHRYVEEGEFFSNDEADNCQQILREVGKFLDNLPNIPTNMVEEYSIIRRRVYSVL